MHLVAIVLAESSGNILDDELLINTLDSSKKTSAKTEQAVKGAEDTMAEIATARENSTDARGA